MLTNTVYFSQSNLFIYVLILFFPLLLGIAHRIYRKKTTLQNNEEFRENLAQIFRSEQTKKEITEIFLQGGNLVRSDPQMNLPLEITEQILDESSPRKIARKLLEDSRQSLGPAIIPRTISQIICREKDPEFSLVKKLVNELTEIEQEFTVWENKLQLVSQISQAYPEIPKSALRKLTGKTFLSLRTSNILILVALENQRAAAEKQLSPNGEKELELSREKELLLKLLKDNQNSGRKIKKGKSVFAFYEERGSGLKKSIIFDFTNFSSYLELEPENDDLDREQLILVRAE